MLATTRLNEPISIVAKRNGYFPKAFVWRGKRYNVRRVEKCWTITGRDLLGRARQHRFRVWTTDGSVYEMCQDLRTDEWFLEKVKSI